MLTPPSSGPPPRPHPHWGRPGSHHPRGPSLDLARLGGLEGARRPKRTLTVKPAPGARGLVKALWFEGVRAQAEASGYGPRPSGQRWRGGQDRLRPACRRSPAGVPVLARRPTYRRLVSTAGLRATIVVYRATSRILNVRFRAAEGRGPDVSILTTARNLRRRRLQGAAAPSLTQRRLRTHRGKVGRMR